MYATRCFGESQRFDAPFLQARIAASGSAGSGAGVSPKRIPTGTERWGNRARRLHAASKRQTNYRTGTADCDYDDDNDDDFQGRT
jgi:hypothetical protein